jgi:transcriptional regulator with XRE-family HTH domain
MDKTAIGKALRQARREENISVNEAAARCGLQVLQIIAMESGSKNYTIVSLLKYAESLHLTITLNHKNNR